MRAAPLVLSLLGTVFPGTVAYAQDVPASTAEQPGTTEIVGDDGGISDIIVTARRRQEPLQDTPLAITAINRERFDEAKVANIADLSNLAPSVVLARNSTNPTSLFPFIRGFGTKSSDPAIEPPIAVTIDGIYQGSLIGAFVNLFDVEAVEVLRGPQGTLLGKNAPSGGVSIRTRRPGTEFAGMAQVDYGSFEELQLRGYVDVPVVPGALYATVSAIHQESDGYMHNTFTGERVGGVNTQSYRLGLLANLGENTTWYVSTQLDFDKGEDTGNRNVSTTDRLFIPGIQYVVLPNPPIACTNVYSRHLCGTSVPNLDRYTTRASDVGNRNSKAFSIASNLDMDFGPVNFAAVTGYRRFKEGAFSDIDGSELLIIQSRYDGIYKQFSHEMRIASSDGGGLDMGGRLNWLLGVYYYNFDYVRDRSGPGTFNLGNPSRNYQAGVTNSYAVFANASFDILDNLSLSVGGRQTWDKKKHSSRAARFYQGIQPELSERDSWDNFSYDASLNYEVTPANMIYVRYATGYRGGGFSGTPATPAQQSTVGPETVKAWEFGSKNDFFNRRLRVNLAVFRAKYDDLQRTISEPVNVTPFFAQIARNAASAKIQGFEVETQVRPIQNLTLRGNVGYADAKYTSFFANITGVAANGPSDLTHLRFAYVPKWTVQVGATYVAELGSVGSLTFVADYAHRSSAYMAEQNFPFSYQPAFGLLSGSITWRDASERFSLSAYAKNLTDEHYIDGGDGVGGLTSFVSDGPPRQIGVSAGVRF